jgi:hypothetical protein
MAEAAIKGLAAGLARIAIGIALAAGISEEAIARAARRHFHHAGTHGHRLAKPLDVASQQPVRLGPMRYYGGPKSPRGRAPIEN